MASFKTRNEDEDDELGYVFLPDCSVSVAFGRLSAEELPEKKWIDVDLKSVDRSDDDSTKHEISSGQLSCNRCDFLLHAITKTPKQADKAELQLTYCALSRFDGTVADSTCDPQTCSASCLLRRKNKPARSDAALLVGVALCCQHLQHIHIRNVKVLLKATKDNKCSSLLQTTVRAALVLTFSAPQLFFDAPTGHPSLQHANTQPPAPIIGSRRNTRRAKRSPCKPLPPSTQLLLSIARSDWEYLDRAMQEIENTLNENVAADDLGLSCSFFPSKLSLEELYLRIQSSARVSVLDQQNIGDCNNKKDDSPPCPMLALPEEMILLHIAPFLRAQSLDSLRLTCRYLHMVLLPVVPGLKLRLYTHQKNSLRWMRLRETRQMFEDDCLGGPTSLDGQCPDGDLYRSVTGGTCTMLQARRTAGSLNRVLVDQQFGHPVEFAQDECRLLARRVARGGLLCDDPGLGKTITVLSLILQTMGLSTTKDMPPNEEAVAETAYDDEAIFKEYWKHEMTMDFRRHPLLQIMSRLQRSPDAYFFSFRSARVKIETEPYDDFSNFVKDMNVLFENAKQSSSPGDEPFEAVCRIANRFHALVDELKAEHVRLAKKKFSNSTAKPNSSVAALLDQQSQKHFIDSLIPSSSTLLVIPSVLMEHWQDQIAHHVDLSYCTDKIPLVFEFRKGTRKVMQARMTDVITKCTVEKSHCPLVFVDHGGTADLPPADFLAMFRIVITSTRRFTNEWKNGSFEDELRRQTEIDLCSYGLASFFRESEEACPLLKVRWLRMIVDEGHTMGRGNHNSSIRFAQWVSAERRWVMTGTPTKQSTSQACLNNVLGLMHYLQHDFFTRRRSGDKAWQKLVSKSWKNGNLASFFRLRSLLSLLMIRHTKLDIAELPPPHYTTTILPMSNQEVTAYNTLVCAVQANLLITSMKGKTSGEIDSLLHASQSAHARKALSNICLVCCGGTRVVPTLKERFFVETLERLEKAKVAEYKKLVVENHLNRAMSEQLSSCMKCGMSLSTLLVFPCGDLVCTECQDNKTSTCPVCSKPFDVDDFQLLQPGFDYQWKWNLKAAPKRFNTLQQSQMIAASDDEDDELDEHIVQSAVDISFVMPEQPRRKYQDGHVCEYHPGCKTGNCLLCLQEHMACNLLNEKRQCAQCYRLARDCPKKESKSYYIVDKLLKLLARQRGSHGESRTLKVIIFSQFRKQLNIVGDRMLKRFGGACVAEYFGSFRKDELHKFTYSDECFCMLLGKDGSEGLDLSFVTHIIFLEEVWDKSLRDQAVARAWRMGASGRVEVETILAKDTVEETMRRLEATSGEQATSNNQNGGSQPVISGSDSGVEYQRAKVRLLLQKLRLIRNNTFTSKEKVPAGTKRKMESDATRHRKVARVRFVTEE